MRPNLRRKKEGRSNRSFPKGGRSKKLCPRRRLCCPGSRPVLESYWCQSGSPCCGNSVLCRCRSVRHLRSEEHTSELQSIMRISYALFCLQKKQTRETDNMLN